MSRNIKEIGKELLGKSLNSYHRRTGLTQLEENNKMQDGILNGILSQVDDAYIEKTEQSNVIHLDGSGDGVVVLDSIEGNTMVNLWKGSASLESNWIQGDLTQEITNKILTVCNLTDKKILFELSTIDGSNTGYSRGIYVEPNSKLKVTVTSNEKKRMTQGRFSDGWLDTEVDKFKKGVLVLEGNYTDKEINYFEGLQSSFEENKEEDKYKIEILSNNKNLWNGTYEIGSISTTDGKDTQNGTNRKRSCYIKVKPNTTYTIKQNVYTEPDHELFVHQYNDCKNNPQSIAWDSSNVVYLGVGESKTFTTSPYTNYIRFRTQDDRNIESVKIVISYANTFDFEPHKQNKIKLLINEPLRAIGDIKDKLCVKDNKLVIERNCGEIKAEEHLVSIYDNHPNAPNSLCLFKINQGDYEPNSISNKLRFTGNTLHTVKSTGDYYITTDNHMWVAFDFNTREKYINYCKENNIVIVSALKMPYYEEVLNEYGEPILLEGYENGTIYIDSTIVPTTTLRYTPKMQSFKTLKEVNNNNVMLTNDIDDNIIPYMMDVDFMIMEKEMALMSHKNIRTIGVKDMTSMQKRTQDMLERLIKGKTLTEQECKTRVAVYLNAGKITDEQAKELNFLIDEIYA